MPSWLYDRVVFACERSIFGQGRQDYDWRYMINSSVVAVKVSHDNANVTLPAIVVTACMFCADTLRLGS